MFHSYILPGHSLSGHWTLHSDTGCTADQKVRRLHIKAAGVKVLPVPDVMLMPLNPWYFSLILPAWYQCCKEPVPWSLYHRPLHLPLLHHRLLLDKYKPHQKARSYRSHWWSAGYLLSQVFLHP